MTTTKARRSAPSGARRRLACAIALLRTPSEARREGFTLIEILVALSLLGLILPALYGILISTVRLREQIQEDGNPYGIGPTILDLIEEDVRGIYFTNVKDNAYFFGETRSVSGRDADRFDCITTVDSRTLLGDDDQSRVRSDVTEVGYALRANPDNSDYLQLFRREDFFVDEEPFAGGRYRLLYDRIRTFDIVYLSEEGGAEEGGSASGNRSAGDSQKEGALLEDDNWDSRDAQTLPRAMQVELEIGVPDNRPGMGGFDIPYRFTRVISFPRDAQTSMAELPTLLEAGEQLQQQGSEEQQEGGGGGRGGGGRGGGTRGGNRGGGNRGGGGAGGLFGGN